MTVVALFVGCRRCQRTIRADQAEACAIAACSLCEECWEMYGYCAQHSEKELDGVLGAKHRPKESHRH